MSAEPVRLVPGDKDSLEAVVLASLLARPQDDDRDVFPDDSQRRFAEFVADDRTQSAVKNVRAMSLGGNRDDPEHEKKEFGAALAEQSVSDVTGLRWHKLSDSPDKKTPDVGNFGEVKAPINLDAGNLLVGEWELRPEWLYILCHVFHEEKPIRVRIVGAYPGYRICKERHWFPALEKYRILPNDPHFITSIALIKQSLFLREILALGGASVRAMLADVKRIEGANADPAQLELDYYRGKAA